MKAPTLFAVAASAAVAAAMAGGLLVIGSPWEARERRLDERRVRDLQAISGAAENYATTTGRLPATLNELREQSPWSTVSIGDPVSGEPYGYAVQNESAIELCARFEAASEAAGGFWDHPAGRHCFMMKISRSGRN